VYIISGPELFLQLVKLNKWTNFIHFVITLLRQFKKLACLLTDPDQANKMEQIYRPKLSTRVVWLLLLAYLNGSVLFLYLQHLLASNNTYLIIVSHYFLHVGSVLTEISITN